MKTGFAKLAGWAMGAALCGTGVALAAEDVVIVYDGSGSMWGQIDGTAKVQIARNIGNAHWHALFFDQALGPNVGGVVNDMSAELAGNSISAEEAAELIKEAVDDSL